MFKTCPNCNVPLIVHYDPIGTYMACTRCDFMAGQNTRVITEMFAFLSVDPSENNSEGIIAVNGPNGPLPLVASDSSRCAFFKTLVMPMVKKTGVKVKLVRFSNREEIEEYGA